MSSEGVRGPKFDHEQKDSNNKPSKIKKSKILSKEENNKHSNKNESIIEIRIQARSFLHNQVRSIVGTLEKVGSGFWTPNDVALVIVTLDAITVPMGPHM